MYNCNITERSSDLDLVVERKLDAPIAKVWDYVTSAELVSKWFVPAPWKITACSIDARPGGEFSMTMQSPEGQSFPHSGCVLAVISEKLFVWTSALGGGFRPKELSQGGKAGEECADLSFTCIVELLSSGTGTIYRARAAHPSVAMCNRHAAMGFNEGWGVCLEQLAQIVGK